MPPRRRAPRTTSPAGFAAALVAVVALTAMLGASCARSGTQASGSQPPATSPSGPTVGTPPPTIPGTAPTGSVRARVEADTRFCREITALGSLLSSGNDREATLAGVAALESLRGEVPPDIATQLDVIAGAGRRLAEIDPSDVNRSMEVVMDPSVQQAFTTLTTYVRVECGVEPAG